MTLEIFDNLENETLDETLESKEFNKALNEASHVPQMAPTSYSSMTIQDFGR